MLPNTLPLDTTPPPAAAAAARRPRPRNDGVREAGRPCTAAPAAVRRSLRRHSPIPSPLHAAHRRQGGQGVNSQNQTMHRSCSAACAAQGSGPPARRRTLPGLPTAGAAAARRVHFAPELPAEPRREPFSPGTPPGVFARPAAVIDRTAARPARNRQEHLKNFKTGRVPYLGLELTMHVIKSQIHLVRQSL